MESLYDPESLRDRDDVTFCNVTNALDGAEHETVRADVESLDSHVVVGVTGDDGDVLLMNDGSHGWTLTAFPVEPGEDWTAVARRGIERVTTGTVEITAPERVREIDYVLEDGDEPLATVYNVVLRASATSKASFEPDADADDAPELRWFDDVPEGVTGPTADDIRLFVD